MILNEFLHATQYYRQPTPLKEERESDLKRIGEYGLDVIQVKYL